jgi:DegV family protein with EDD domain
MQKIGIITDEGCDLTKELIERHQIAIVPVKLIWPEIENIPGDNAFQKMRELEKKGIRSFGKTSQPSPKDFLEKYLLQLQKFEKVVCITLTSKLSGTYNSAVQAKSFLTPQDQERVFIADTLNASAPQGLLILKAIDLINSGKEPEAIAKEIEESFSKVHLYLTIEATKWMEYSGRISHVVAVLLDKMFKSGIRPLLTFKNGKIIPLGLKTKSKDAPMLIFKQFTEEAAELLKEKKKIRVAITHGDDIESAERIKRMIEVNLKNVDVVFINLINNVVGSITGPDTLAFGWCEE